MVDDAVLKNAPETACTMYQARYPDVGARDSRRCLLERHLRRRQEERDSDTEELTSFGIAYLHRLPRDECYMKMLVARVARGSTRPSWTLLAIAFLISAVVVIGLRIVFGA